jgi:hypothetical protein
VEGADDKGDTLKIGGMGLDTQLRLYQFGTAVAISLLNLYS